ncbi:MAG: hypothetical protein KJ630_18995 [Proteobacteria bacterium]|nr:hypothetical protein [Pseudomonadota bacterium]
MKIITAILLTLAMSSSVIASDRDYIVDYILRSDNILRESIDNVQSQANFNTQLALGGLEALTNSRKNENAIESQGLEVEGARQSSVVNSARIDSVANHASVNTRRINYNSQRLDYHYSAINMNTEGISALSHGLSELRESTSAGIAAGAAFVDPDPREGEGEFTAGGATYGGYSALSLSFGVNREIAGIESILLVGYSYSGDEEIVKVGGRFKFDM